MLGVVTGTMEGSIATLERVGFGSELPLVEGSEAIVDPEQVKFCLDLSLVEGSVATVEFSVHTFLLLV